MTEHIELPTQTFASNNADINLSQLNSTWLVLYFYPKDSTPGCTTQAIEFTSLVDDFAAIDAQVIGISRDSVKSHQNFCEKQNLKINLISDKDETLCRHFDVIKEKNMYGKTVMGIERSTFIFKGAQWVKSYRKVKAAGHAEAVLADLKSLQV